MSDIRAPQIIEAQIQGKTQHEIAEDLGTSRMTIYRDKQTDLYGTLVNEFIETYITRILEFANSDKDTFRLEGNKEIGRMLRTGITRQTRHTEDIKLTADLTITENRREKDALIKSLELTPDQYKILEAQVNPEKEGA